MVNQKGNTNYKKIVFYDFDIPFLLKDLQYPVGGAAVELLMWITGFRIIKCPLAVVSFKGAQKLIEKTKHSDIEIIEAYEPNRGIRLLRWFYYRIPSLFVSVKKSKARLLFQEVAGLETGVAALIAKCLGLDFIYRVANDIEVDHRIKQKMPLYARMAFHYGLNRASAIVCQNKYQLDCLKLRYPNKPMTVLYNPIASKSSGKILSRKNRLYIAWVGVFQKQKNLGSLLEIVNTFPEVIFKIAGMPSKTIDEDTSSALSELKKCKNVSFAGYVKRDELPTFLSEAIFLLNTSHYEGFSNTYLEAFTAGTPVCTTSNADPDSIVRIHGLGVTSDTHSSLSEAVRRLIDYDDYTYNELTVKCSQYVGSYHNPEKLAEEFCTFIHDSLQD